MGTWDPDGRFWYRVKAGDTLEDLAATYLGSKARWPSIYNRNRRLISSSRALAIDWCIAIAQPVMGGTRRSANQCSWGRPITGNPPDSRTIRAANRLGVNWYNLTESKLRSLTERITEYKRNVPWWAWPGTLATRTFRYLSWAVVARGLDAAFGSTRLGYKNGMRLVWGSRLPRSLSPIANMFTLGNSVYIRPGVVPTEAEYAHEYIHTLQYLGSDQVGLVSRYAVEEVFGDEFGKGSVSNRLEAIAYLWQGWIETYRQSGIISKPRMPWFIWTLPTVL